MEKVLNEEQQSAISALIDNARKVVVVGHVGPDGDAIGSTLAVNGWMKRLGKESHVIVPNRFPDFLMWLPGAAEILLYDKRQEEADALINDADLIWVCDLNQSSRVDAMESVLVSSSAAKILVDHHIGPGEFCDVTVSQPTMSAACEVLCHLLWQIGEIDNISLDEAVCLYTGMMTDTGAFTFNSNRPVVFECISRLLEHGVDKDKIYRNVFWTATPARMRVTGYLLYVKMEIMKGLHSSIMTLTNVERKRLGIKNGDTEGIVNMPLQIQGMRLSAFLNEDTEHPGVIKFSLRSVDDVPCNEIMEKCFGGGGHKNAAGGSFNGTMDEAVEALKRALNKYQQYLVG